MVFLAQVVFQDHLARDSEEQFDASDDAARQPQEHVEQSDHILIQKLLRHRDDTADTGNDDDRHLVVFQVTFQLEILAPMFLVQCHGILANVFQDLFDVIQIAFHYYILVQKYVLQTLFLDYNNNTRFK